MLDHPRAGEPDTARRRWRRAVGAAAVAVAVTAAVPTAAALAKPAPRAHHVQGKLTRMQDRAEQITEQYNGKRWELGRARHAQHTAQRRMRNAKRELTRLNHKVVVTAAAQYMSGGADTGVASLFGAGPQQVLDRTAALSHMNRNQTAELNNLRRLTKTYTSARNTARTKTGQVRSATEQIGRKKKRIETLIGQIKDKLAESHRKQRARQRARQRHTATPSPTHSVPPTTASPSRTTPSTPTTPNKPSTPSTPNKPSTPSGPSTPPSTGGSGGGSGGSSGGSASSKAQRAVQYALSKVGDPYVWGAAGPNSFDCSGLTMWAYRQVGINLPHYTGAQYAQGRHISMSDIRPGDLIFFYSDLHHVGMYIGHGKMVDAPHTGANVRVESFGGRPIGGVARFG